MKLVFATNNDHKLKEIRSLTNKNIDIISLKDAGINEDIPETEKTLEGNAYLKSSFVHNRTGKNCFADDTGLEVEALDGEPGVFSARYSRMGDLTFPDMEISEANIKKLLISLENKKNRNARFRTVISLIFENKEYKFEGIVKGEIIKEKKGEEGFGYDPVFLPQGYSKTFAEMNLEEKNKISHRALATRKLVEFLNKIK